jgi:hypothetical protein
MRELGAGAVVGGYQIETVVGRGGMGIVYRAAQRRPERTVALKVITPDLADDEGFRARFERESNMAARIEHPHVIPVYEVGDDDGLLYIVMRYVAGTDLRALVERQGRLAPPRAARIVAQVGGALDAAHRRGLVHRDVKPANVLISDEGDQEHAYLTDFGLVKLIESETSGVTATGAFVGTLDYLAPEQLDGEADARSDVYALGGVLYNALTGAPPYPQPTAAAKMWAQVNAPPPSVAAAAPDAPAEFDGVVMRAMAKRPADRYPSAGDLGRAALAAASPRQEAPDRDDEETVARDDAAPTERAQRPERPQPPLPPARRTRADTIRWAVAGVVAVAVVAVAALALTGVFDGGSENRREVPAETTEAAEPSTTTTDAEAGAAQPQVIGQVTLDPLDKSDRDTVGVAAVAKTGNKTQLAVQGKLPPRAGEEEAYEVWLYNSRDDALSIGAQRTDRDGNYQGAGDLPADYRKYKYIDISAEKVDDNREHSGQSVLRGEIADLVAP